MKKSIKIIINTIVLVASTVVFSNAFGQKVMTLEDCRKQAVEFNKELKAAALQNKEAKVNQEVARTAYLPKFGFSSSLMHRPNMDPISMPGYFLPTADSEEDALAGNYSGTSNVWKPGTTIDINSLTLINSSFQLTQPVYAGGKIRYSNQQADAGVEIADLSSDKCAATDTNRHEATQMQAKVRMPVFCCSLSRSTPTIPPSRTASNNLAESKSSN